MIRDEFDKQFGDIEFHSDAELRKEEWKRKQKEGARKKRLDPEYLAKIRKVNSNPERRAAISKKNMKSIESPFGTYASQKEFDAAKIIGARWIDRHQVMPHLYYYTDTGPGEVTYENVVNTPLGKWRSRGSGNAIGGVQLAFVTHVKNNDPLAVGLNDISNWWRKMKRDYPDQFFVSKEPKKEWLEQNRHSAT